MQKVKFGLTQQIINLKVLLISEAWSSSAPLLQALDEITGGFGTQTAGLIAGGASGLLTGTGNILQKNIMEQVGQVVQIYLLDKT